MKEIFAFIGTEHTQSHSFNQSLEYFRDIIGDNSTKKFTSESTIREVVQNSLDAQLDMTKPVEVIINSTSVQKSDLPGIESVFEHIKSLNPGNNYTLEITDHMKKLEKLSTIDVLTLEDRNTTGLSTSKTTDGLTPYEIYAYNTGIHGASTNVSEQSRGGSHGVGKIAINSASDIHLMYFANHDENGVENLGGSVELFDHKYNNRSYRGTGFLIENTSLKDRIPLINKDFHEIFHKSTRGLKIIIPYIRFTSDPIDIVKSIINNFFIAILKEKLIAQVIFDKQKYIINKDTIKKLVNDEKIYPTDDEDELKIEFTPRYLQAYTEYDAQPIKVELPAKYNESYNFNLYFMAHDKEINSGRTAIFRSIGMKIEDHKVPGKVRAPYTAVLIGGPNEDEYLKTLENKSHTEISAKSLRDKESQNKAIKFINGIDKEIRKVIDENLSVYDQPQGKLNTDELFYKANLDFSRVIKSSTQTIEIGGDNIKINKRVKKESRSERKTSGEKASTPESKRKRKPRKLKTTSESSKGIFVMQPESIKRAVAGTYEMLEINFLDIDEFNKIDIVDISLKVIDGDGKEYDDELNLIKCYEEISDYKSGDIYKFDEDKIYDVKIYNKKINLIFKFTNNGNRSLKYIYKVGINNDIY